MLLLHEIISRSDQSDAPAASPAEDQQSQS